MHELDECDEICVDAEGCAEGRVVIWFGGMVDKVMHRVAVTMMISSVSCGSLYNSV